MPERDRTAVVVPLLVGSVEAAAQALEHLEVQYLANRDPQIRFALLSDFLDAPTEIAVNRRSDHPRRSSTAFAH